MATRATATITMSMREGSAESGASSHELMLGAGLAAQRMDVANPPTQFKAAVPESFDKSIFLQIVIELRQTN